MDWAHVGRTKVAVVCIAVLQLTTAAIAGTPTVQELLAEEDQTLVNQLVDWDKQFLTLPDDVELDRSLRDAAQAMLQAHRARVRELVPLWIAQEREQAQSPTLRGRALWQPILNRMFNEMAVWSVESTGTAQDEAWLKATLAPMACRIVPLSFFARQMALIQSAPPESRPALLADEQTLISHWGTKRATLPERPSTQDLEAADRAIDLLRAGLPNPASPMTPYLAGQLFDRERKPGKSDRWEQCAKSQWWLASQMAKPNADRALALVVYRYSTMPDVRGYVPSVANPPAKPASGSGENAYPPEASYFGVRGTTSVRVQTDGHGKPIGSRISARTLVVPGVRDNRPVAFEALLDAASIDIATRRHFLDGTGETTINISWNQH